jgi:hypothetical protein
MVGGTNLERPEVTMQDAHASQYLFPLPTPADAARRIEEWFRRGYVLFSDIVSQSTHLRPVAAGEKGRSPPTS